MLIRKNTIILLLFAFHVGAEVFKTNEIPVVPAEDLIPPPEDQESILVRFSGNEPIPPKSFFQRIVTWFGFNGDQGKNGRKPPQKQVGQKQSGYVYENPAKPFSPPPAKLQQSIQTSSYQPPGYQYEDPSKNLQNGFRYEPSPLKLQQQPPTGYTYDKPEPAKIQQQPQQNGYSYDPPKLQLQPQSQPLPTGYTYDPPLKLQLQPQLGGYTYNPPNPVKLQESKPTGYTYNPPPQKLQEPSKQPPFTGYNYDIPPNPLKLQRPLSFNDLVSSAASPTAVYGLPPIPGFNQAQTSDSFPCNKIPWMPMFPSAQEYELLRAKLQAKNPNYLQSLTGYQYIQPIARPQPEKFQQQPQQQPQQQQQLNAHTYLPPRQRPLRQPSINQINSINSLPLQSTAQPFKAPSPTISSEYLPAQKIVLPVETTQHNLVPLQVQSLSITPVPPLYDPKPFTFNDAKANGFYINGHLVTPTGLSTTSVQSLQYVNQNHPVTQSQNIVQPSDSYGAPLTATQPTPFTYGTPPATYGPPTNTYGTPPIKLTAEVTESSVFGRFKASQPFTARSSLSTPSPSHDQSRLGSNNLAQSSNLIDKPILISDSAADASESTRSPQDANRNTISDEYQPILQVLHELNVTTTPQGFQYTATSTVPSISMSSASQYKKKEKKENNRETPLDLLDTPIHHFRKTSVGPSSTPNPHDSNDDDDRLADFKFMRNTWKPLAPPSSFAHSQSPSVVTTSAPAIDSSPVTPSAASAAFQPHTPRDANTLNGYGHRDNNSRPKTKKVQVIIPYTSNSRPSPFKNAAELQSFESSAGWSNSNHHDDHNSEESQLISSATPSPNGNSASKHNHHHRHSPYLTKIIAKNIRELLKREHLKNISSVDLEKLQKNIDGWTEQEFSMQLNRASTISLLAPSKHIPFEYLTTTQSLQDMLTTETIQPTTDYPTTSYDTATDDEVEVDDDSQDEGEQIDNESEDENEIKRPDNGGGNENLQPDEQQAIQQAEEIEDDDFKRLDFIKALENNQVSGSEHQIFYATNPPPSRPPQQQQQRETTPRPPCSSTPPTDDSYVRTTVLPSADELWNKLKSLLTTSDKGKEKVYIVTPQPYPSYFESAKIMSDDENEVKFKSPRFLVRPTPGAATGRSSNSFARLTFKPRANRLQATTVKTTWNEASTDPVSTETFRSSTHSHSVVNGHAHAQAFSYVKPNSFSDDAQNVHTDEDDGTNIKEETEEQEDDDLIEGDTHRSTLYEYKH